MTQHPRKPVHVESIPIRWGDMDAYGHVNNTVFFRFMEQARVAWMEAIVGKTLVAPEAGIVIVNASCTFLKQLDYPGVVEVKMSVGPPGRSSLMSFYEIFKRGDAEPYADGAAKIVWVDQRVRRSAPIPDWVREKIAF
ncbi:MAG: acyl-CoA thioesterase [Pseudomonadota bacterium]